eukprot:CAMPEP_0116886162 /NCGR_PEP_ID=MMETSP0463-20121206/19856_1 /TAXON_ID=181622 /ORGANISM="Strombidinopsis sp, Strain SopsisLIS2011" /LENGTH=60 /DNA_ID=CAMNT_0004545995 /DNA_START=19 /DNA_END=201 /DNA_ORIENTATION=-
MKLSQLYLGALLACAGQAVVVDLTSYDNENYVWPMGEPIIVEAGDDITFKMVEVTKLAYW